MFIGWIYGLLSLASILAPACRKAAGRYWSLVQTTCDDLNSRSRVVTVLPMTSKLKKEWMATHIPLSEEEIEKAEDYGYFDPSMVLAEQVTTVDKRQFRSYVGRVIHEGKIKELEGAAMAQLGMKEGNTNEDYHV